MSRWLLQGETDPLGADERAWKLDFNLDFQERIDQLRQDFFDLHNRIHQDFENRATSVEPYRCPGNQSENHLAQRPLGVERLGSSPESFQENPHEQALYFWP